MIKIILHKINNIKSKILMYVLRYYVGYCRIYSKKSVEKSAPLIISLTSYHKRFPTLFYTLESIFQQRTDLKYEVILVLSQEDIDIFGGLPTHIEEYQSRGLNLIVVEENLKSYKKAYYTAELGKPIITIDDDVYYPSWWLQRLMLEVNKTPNTVLAYRGHYILRKNGDFLKYKEWLKTSDNNYIIEPKYSFLPTGTSGVYYPVGALNGLNRSKDIFLKLCPHADDFWFKYLTVSNGFKAKRIVRKNIHFKVISCGESLFEINVAGGENDKQFKKILAHDSNFHQKLCNEMSI